MVTVSDASQKCNYLSRAHLKIKCGTQTLGSSSDHTNTGLTLKTKSINDGALQNPVKDARPNKEASHTNVYRVVSKSSLLTCMQAVESSTSFIRHTEKFDTLADLSFPWSCSEVSA